MWGVRAIRVGVFLALVAVAGCCERCQSVWKGDTRSAPPAAQDEATVPDQKDWKRGGGWFKDQPERIPPERIHGGIY